MINIGGNIGEVYVGSTKIAEAYVGNQLVYRSAPEVLPYDAEVEWLGSSGSQYIQLPLDVAANTFFEVEFDVLIETINASSERALFGGNPWRQCLVAYNSNANNKITFSSYLGNKTTSGGVGIAMGSKTHVIFSTTQIHTYTEDGDITNRSLSRSLSAAITAFRIFRGYRYTSEYPCKIYDFKITVGNNLVYNLIPVRKDGVGYMYDKVSKELFGNAGSGSFTYGNDVTN